MKTNKKEQLPRLKQLLCQQRWAALASLGDNNQPEASMVAYVPDMNRGIVYLHLSELAGHTRNLIQHPRASLAISENDTGTGDPQQLARISLFGHVAPLERGTEAYQEGKQQYLDRLPDAEPLFDFADFTLLCFHIDKIRFVGGFAQAHTYRPEELGE